MTDAIKRKLQDEIDALEHELIHEPPKEIKKAAALGEKASAAKLPDDKKALAEAGKAWAGKYNFLDAVRFLEASLA